VVHPILQPSTAYWMLRPFFKPTRKDSLTGWKFSLDDDDGNVFLHGANPGTAQEHTPDLHPHLRLAETMIPYPTVEPGDAGGSLRCCLFDNQHVLTKCQLVFWSADTIHGTEMENTGKADACVFYIPSVPLTPNNAVSLFWKNDRPLNQIGLRPLIQHYIAQQRDSFTSGIPPPDFPGGRGESQFADATYLTEVQSDWGKQAMGLKPIPVHGKNGKQSDLAEEVNTILGF